MWLVFMKRSIFLLRGSRKLLKSNIHNCFLLNLDNAEMAKNGAMFETLTA